jgi:spermidine/putrescine transport system substrate-binding protein
MAVGIAPEKSTPDDWSKAADKLKQQKQAGLVRKYYDQSYTDALTSGEVWIAQAWSGDIYQMNSSQGTSFEFVVPEEGVTLWTDNMTIPITATNPVDAMMLIDFFYSPEIAASLAEFINYITPVPEAKDVVTQDAAKAEGDDKAALSALADSPLVFPTTEDYARAHYYRQFATPTEQQDFNAVFEPIVLS